MKGIRFVNTVQMKLIIIYVLMILVAMQLIGIYFFQTVENSFISNFRASMNKQGNLLAEYVKPYLSGPQDASDGGRVSYEDLHDVVNNFNKISAAEIQVIDTNGIILSSSQAQFSENQKNTQIEVTRALQGMSGNEWDVVDSLGVRKRAAAIPVWDDGKVIGAIYIVQSMEDMFITIDRIKRIFIVGTLIALTLTAMLGIILSNTITQPIKEITKRATAMAEGDFDQTVRVQSFDEIGQLGYAFNYMTHRLKEALSSIEEEKDKLASILSNMSDGVIATDEWGRTIVINRRATEMLQRKEAESIGHEITELLGLTKEEVDALLNGEQKTTMLEIKLSEEESPLKIRVVFTPIYRREQGVTGTIIVLQDVTEQENLEQSRKEFVANVSHELRTPLTSIKSYLEALDDGAMEDPQLAKRFLNVTRNETERMIRLVTDLLQLSRLDSKQAIIVKEKAPLRNMLEDVADRFSFQLMQRSIEISIHVDPEIDEVLMDPDQIDQVLDNLVSNAIKYTPDHGFIELRAMQMEDGSIEVSIEDTGIGIPKKDLERIFERFYRVDKARSRSMGGTGLGLSIAREIIKAHGGTIRIESEVEKGTKVVFTLRNSEEEVQAL